MLARALVESSVSVGVRAEDWREAVEVSGKLLVASGAAEESYVTAMVRIVEELGAYAVIAPGVALPHARPEDGALGLGLSLAALAEPVEFGSPEKDPVSLVFGLAASESDAQVELLGQLADFIEDEQSLRELRRAASAEQIIAIMEGGVERDQDIRRLRDGVGDQHDSQE